MIQCTPSSLHFGNTLQAYLTLERIQVICRVYSALGRIVAHWRRLFQSRIFLSRQTRLFGRNRNGVSCVHCIRNALVCFHLFVFCHQTWISSISISVRSFHVIVLNPAVIGQVGVVSKHRVDIGISQERLDIGLHVRSFVEEGRRCVLCFTADIRDGSTPRLASLLLCFIPRSLGGRHCLDRFCGSFCLPCILRVSPLLFGCDSYFFSGQSRCHESRLLRFCGVRPPRVLNSFPFFCVHLSHTSLF